MIHAPRALLPTGWARDVRVSVDGFGRIEAVTAGASPAGADVVLAGRVLLPAPSNLHSHGFQRALAGRTQRRGGQGAGQDSFWTWRQLMYRFVDALTPSQVEAITAQAQVEMLEAGYAAVAEFHYLHHAPGGVAYDHAGEMGVRVMQAAEATGIGLTLLPVLYAAAGVDGRAPEQRQGRFACDIDRFERVWQCTSKGLAAGRDDWRLGIAPHSLRATPPAQLSMLLDEHPQGPVHIHIAEQVAEVDEVRDALGATPVAWLLDHHEVDGRWCLVHATHINDAECDRLARSGATAGLCPITEADLGDGVFPARRYVDAGGKLGVGTDSNVCITLAGELQLLEYGQRLVTRQRNVLGDDVRSVGRRLFELACEGGARALGRDAGAVVAGRWADLCSIDDSAALHGLDGDELLDGWVFSTRGAMVRDVWSAGRHLVEEGRHVAREAVAARYRRAIDDLVGAA